MSSSRVVGASDCHAKVETFLGSMAASSDTVESIIWGAADEAGLYNEHKKRKKSKSQYLYATIYHHTN